MQAQHNSDTLYPGQELRDDATLRSRNETFHAVLKKDGEYAHHSPRVIRFQMEGCAGNFVFTHGHWYGGRTLWQTNTHEKGAKPNRLIMRSDGTYVTLESYSRLVACCGELLWHSRRQPGRVRLIQ